MIDQQNGGEGSGVFHTGGTVELSPDMSLTDDKHYEGDTAETLLEKIKNDGEGGQR